MLICPGCKTAFSGATSTRGRTEPAAGSMTVCINCHAVGVFVDGPFGMSIREATDAELHHWAHAPEARRLMAALLAARAKLGAPYAARTDDDGESS